VINKVKYVSLTGKIQEGYDALIIPLVSDLYLKVRARKQVTAITGGNCQKG